MTFNPFALTGPEFLRFYLFCLTVVIVYGLIRRWLYLDALGSDLKVRWLPYEMACLAGGHRRVAEAAIAELLRRKVLVLDKTGDILTVSKDAPEVTEPAELAVHAAVVGGRTSLRAMRNSFITPPEVMGRLLKYCMVANANLLSEPLDCRRFGVLPLRLLAGFGAVRLLLGVVSGRPVGFLFVLCVATLILSFIWTGKPDYRTSRGRQLLAGYLKRNTALAVTARRRGATLSHNDFVFAAGLFGVPAVLTGDLAWMQGIFAPLPPPLVLAKGKWGGKSDSGCGSGCGSSSSCSSCGGGGCGGCGG